MKIQILMSTYNGGAYLQTQLESIISQTVADKQLLIRDDGSTDQTIEVIREYQRQYPWISYYNGENIGVQRSFFNLMEHADLDADYFAFADQDDEWLPKKLERAVTCLARMEKRQQEQRKRAEKRVPLLYCSDKQIVGKNLEPLRVTVSRPVRKISFGNALVQNICTGCTAVVNRELMRLVKEHFPKNPELVIMHDWWLYLAASCFGDVYYDERAYILYRQHGKNASGAIVSQKKLLEYRLKQLREPRGKIYRQVEEFFRAFRNAEILLDRDKLGYKVLASERSMGERINILFSKKIFRQKCSDNLVLKVVILLGRL